MNKKQAGIIVTLLVLIIFAGVLATKVNDPLYADGDLIDDNSAITMTENQSSTTYFETSRLEREQRTVSTLQKLQDILDNENVSEEEKTKASASYQEIALRTDNEGKLELKLKGQGFEDAICYIDGNKVKVIVKVQNDLTDEQLNQIRDIVMDQTEIKDVEILPKK